MQLCSERKGELRIEPETFRREGQFSSTWHRQERNQQQHKQNHQQPNHAAMQPPNSQRHAWVLLGLLFLFRVTHHSTRVNRGLVWYRWHRDVCCSCLPFAMLVARCVAIGAWMVQSLFLLLRAIHYCKVHRKQNNALLLQKTAALHNAARIW